MTPLDYLAAYRLTRLATEDALLHHPREAVVRWAYAQTGHSTTTAPAGGWAEQARAEGPDAPKLATLATCPWCASVWVVAGVLAARRVAPRTWGMLSRVLAGSAVVGLLGGLERVTHSLWPNLAHGLYVWACAAGQRHSSAQRPTLTPGPCPEHKEIPR